MVQQCRPDVLGSAYRPVARCEGSAQIMYGCVADTKLDSVMRNRTAGVLSRFFLFGLDRGIVDASPAAGIRRLPERPRDRFLSMEEIRSLWLGLDEIDAVPQVRLAIKMALATGQRRFEIAGFVRSEIDDVAALWRLPGKRTKNGYPNLIPLPPLLVTLIAEADGHRVRPPPTLANRKNRRPEYVRLLQKRRGDFHNPPRFQRKGRRIRDAHSAPGHPRTAEGLEAAPG